MKKLGDPQEKLRVIHIAGTSGKGSTSYLISSALMSQGFKTGLHLSPHILDIRERCLINNQYISQKQFVEYLRDVMPAVQAVEQSELGMPTYFEIMVAMAYFIFWKERVDFAVIETGLGGLFDGTNVVRNPSKIAVITRIGLDHMQVLGNTYAKIAQQKAGIIHQGNTVVSAWQNANARLVIKEEAKKKRARIYFLQRGKEFNLIKTSLSGITFEFSFKTLRCSMTVGLLGEHQAQNAALALGALVVASKQYSFDINLQSAKQQLSRVRFPGRMDVRKMSSKTVILDGAHNPQKMASFLKALQTLFPQKKFHFLIAFKKGKEAEKMLAQIVPFASSITFTGFFTNSQGLSLISQNPGELPKLLASTNIPVSITETPAEGLQKALTCQEDAVVITGSLYLLSELYQLPRVTRSTEL